MRHRARRLVDQSRFQELRREAIHALLNRPWITKEEDPELYYWIKDHQQELKEWFREQAGFSLIVTRLFVKLDKAPLIAKPWMGFPEFHQPLDYCFFTYGLWYLEGKTEMDQFLLKDLIEEIRDHMTGQEMHVDWKNYRHRQSMVRALKKLRELGVLRVVEGDEADWLADEENVNTVLYEGSPLARYVLRRFPRDLTTYQRMEELNELMEYPDTPEGAAKQRRHRVYRRFLLEPVVLDRDWNEEDRYYVMTQRHSLIEQMRRMLGWVGRRYREGLLFFDPEPLGESELFPNARDAYADLVMLVATEIRQRMEDSYLQKEAGGTVRITRSEMEAILLHLREKFGEFWNKEMRSLESKKLADHLSAYMESWGLGTWEDEQNFLLSPVLGRWNAKYQADLEN